MSWQRSQESSALRKRCHCWKQRNNCLTTSTRFSSSIVFSSTSARTFALMVFGKEQVLLHLLLVSTPVVQNSWKVDPSQVSSCKNSFYFLKHFLLTKKWPGQDQASALFAPVCILHRLGLQVAPVNISWVIKKKFDQGCTSVGMSVVKQSVLLETRRHPGRRQMSACSCSLHSMRGIATWISIYRDWIFSKQSHLMCN